MNKKIGNSSRKIVTKKITTWKSYLKKNSMDGHNNRLELAKESMNLKTAP